ncbi:hypothetical protein [Streptomyces sp. NPDC047928]|uniref:hypothetical protein n=1 Tax=unclassified Streptomyces TaxID=2593676 RepID=UPI0037234DAF
MTVPVARAAKRMPSSATALLAADSPSEQAFSFFAAGSCAVLSAVVHLGALTYTLAHYRHWDPVAAFFVSAVFAAVALLSTVPHLVAEAVVTTSALPRVMMWGTSLTLAALQITAAVLGDAHFTLSALIGTITILAVACFGEMAGHALAEA